MKKILSLLIFILVGTSFFTASSYAANASDVPSTAQTNKDGEIIALLVAADKNEIAVAKEALKKGTTPAVKHYAKLLKLQHTKNLNGALKLSKKIGIAPIETATVISLQEDGAKELVTLSSLKGKEFNKEFVDAMVTGHTDVLKMIDDNFLKNVSNPSLKKFVLATRPHIEAHLKQGQKIQKSLN